MFAARGAAHVEMALDKSTFVVVRVLSSVGLYLASALTRDFIVFFVSLTFSVAFTVIHVAAYARRVTTQVAQTFSWFGIVTVTTSVVLAFFSLVFPLQPGIREATYVFFVLGLTLAAVSRVVWTVADGSATKWRVVVHVWEWSLLLVIMGLGASTLAEVDLEKKQTLQTTIVALVGFTSIASVLDIDF